jgi:hypothetical protein
MIYTYTEGGESGSSRVSSPDSVLAVATRPRIISRYARVNRGDPPFSLGWFWHQSVPKRAAKWLHSCRLGIVATAGGWILFKQIGVSE